MARLMARSEFPDALKWNLADIYPTEADWEAEILQMESDLATVSQYRGRLGESPATLLACLQALDQAEARGARAAAYGQLFAFADGSSTEGQARGARGAQIRVRVSTAQAAVESELARLGTDQLGTFLAAEPGLLPYRPFLDKIAAEAAHTLSPEVEQAVAALSGAMSTPVTVYNRILFADAQFEPITDRNGQPLRVGPDIGYRTTGRIPDRETRRRSAASLTAGLQRHRHSMAASLGDHIRNQVALARLRGYPSAEAMLLAKDRVDPQVYRTLLETIRAELPQHLQRWMRLRARVMGTDQVHLYDLWAPLDEEPLPPLSPEAGAAFIREGLAPLGAEYAEILDRSFGERWIDWADNIGKPAVQFAMPVPGVHPYVLTAWQHTHANARGLAHELGHAAHFVLSERSQPFQTQRSSKVFNEAPSTANELLVGYHWLDTAQDARSRREAIHLLLTTYHGMVVLIGSLADLESRLYQEAEAGRPLTADRIEALLTEVWQHYFGDTLVSEPEALLEWMLWPQFYMNLYFWTYPAGLCCAYSVVEAIRQEGEAAAVRWLDVLRMGGSLPPEELMRRAEVEIGNPETVRRCVVGFGKLVEELERCYE